MTNSRYLKPVALVSLVLASAMAAAAGDTPPRMAGGDHYFDSAGVKIHYIDTGPRDGEPIVLVHGFSRNMENAWKQAGSIDALDDEYRVIALDCRGHGKSDKPHDPEKYGAAMAADVIRLLDHLHIERAHLVGYSMGAGIAFKLMVDHPDRLLSAMPCGFGLRPQTAEEQKQLEARASALERAGRTEPASDESDAEAPLDRGLQQFVAFVSRGNDPAALAAVLRTADEVMPDVSELEHNSVPSLSILGEHDLVASITWTAERMANLDVKIIEGANHFTAPSHPDFVPAIKSFVGKHGLTPPARQRGMVHACEACDLLAPGAQFLDEPLDSDDLLVHKSEFFKVYLFPGDQRYLGRCLVVLERHSSSLANLSSDEWEDLQDVIQVMEEAARRAFGAVGFNWTCLMNNAFREDPPQPHVHLHFRPRYAAAVAFEGSLFEDVRFGEHYDRVRVPAATEMALAIAAALRKAAVQVR